MNEMVPRLSLCIATRNRAGFIGNTLDGILACPSPDIEVVVVDGASSDGTAEEVAVRAARDPRLRLVRLTGNGGVDRDYDRAVQEATGRHCWLMTDDDALEPGAIEIVLEACGRGHQLVVIDALVCGPDLQEVLNPNRLAFTGERSYPPGDPRLLADLGSHLTFIGAVIIAREVWLARAREPYYGSLFIHVGVIFQAPLSGSALAIGRPLIRIRYGLGGWVPRRFEVWMFLWPGLIWSFTAFSTEIRGIVCAAEPWRRISLLAAFRAKGAYGLAEYRQFLKPRMGWVRRLPHLLVALMPGLLLNLVALTVAHLRRQADQSGLIDLRASRFHWRRWGGT